jgi:hypothetical protein
MRKNSINMNTRPVSSGSKKAVVSKSKPSSQGQGGETSKAFNAKSPPQHH